MYFCASQSFFIPNSRNNLGSDSISMSFTDGLPPNGLLFGSIWDFIAKDFFGGGGGGVCYWFILFIVLKTGMLWICLDSIVMSFYYCQVCHCIALQIIASRSAASHRILLHYLLVHHITSRYMSVRYITWVSRILGDYISFHCLTLPDLR